MPGLPGIIHCISHYGVFLLLRCTSLYRGLDLHGWCIKAIVFSALLGVWRPTGHGLGSDTTSRVEPSW